MAPDKGSETRDKLSQSLKDLGESIKDAAADQIEKLSEVKDKIVSKVKGDSEDTLENFQSDTEQA